jgi:Fur family transcriptional regulator, ferric uptake regulator
MVQLEREIGRFQGFLQQQGLKLTSERTALVREIFSTHYHFEADELLFKMKEKSVKISRATVYRTLELLVRSGLVVERDFGEGFKRFEAARGIPHHEHLLCSLCGRVTEFRDERLERMTMLIAEQHGYSRQGHRLVISGICAECRAR